MESMLVRNFRSGVQLSADVNDFCAMSGTLEFRGTHQLEQYDGPHAYKRNVSSKVAATANNNCAAQSSSELSLLEGHGKYQKHAAE